MGCLNIFFEKNNLTTLFWGGINFISSTNRQPFPGWAAVMSQRRMTWWPRNWSVVWFPETARGFSGNYAPNRGKDTAWWVLEKIAEVKSCYDFVHRLRYIDLSSSNWALGSVFLTPSAEQNHGCMELNCILLLGWCERDVSLQKVYIDLDVDNEMLWELVLDHLQM